MPTKQQILSGMENEEDIIKSRLVQGNTVEVAFKDGTKVIRFHATNIVTIGDDKVVLTSGGYRTSTTKERLISHCPFILDLWQKNNIWYIGYNDQIILFYDGIIFDLEGTLLSELREDPKKKVAQIKRKITKFVNLLDGIDKIPQPSGGDCWDCMMVVADGKDKGTAMGDAFNNHEHLHSHMEQEYMVGSMLATAMREAGFRDDQIGFHYMKNESHAFKRSLRKYLTKRLLSEVL